MTEVRILADDQRLLVEVANQFEAKLTALPEGERLRVALTGGSLGISLLAELSKRAVDVRLLEIFWGDERWVPLTHPDRNEFQSLSAWPALSDAKLHRFGDPEVIGLAEAASTMDSEFSKLNQGRPVAFDLVLLGVGPDGHVASLFPGHSASQNRWVVWEENSPKPPARRISFSYEALNSSSAVWFMASGAAKADVVSSAIRLGNDSELPCARVKGLSETVWYVDQEISQKL